MILWGLMIRLLMKIQKTVTRQPWQRISASLTSGALSEAAAVMRELDDTDLSTGASRDLLCSMLFPVEHYKSFRAAWWAMMMMSWTCLWWVKSWHTTTSRPHCKVALKRERQLTASVCPSCSSSTSALRMSRRATWRMDQLWGYVETQANVSLV